MSESAPRISYRDGLFDHLSGAEKLVAIAMDAGGWSETEEATERMRASVTALCGGLEEERDVALKRVAELETACFGDGRTCSRGRHCVATFETKTCAHLSGDGERQEGREHRVVADDGLLVAPEEAKEMGLEDTKQSAVEYVEMGKKGVRVQVRSVGHWTDLVEDDRLTLKVVVSGAPFKVGVTRQESISGVIDAALLGAGIKRRDDIGTWHVRTEQGVILESLAAVQDGATLFLDPEAGGGANSEVPGEENHRATLETIRDEAFRWGQGEEAGRTCGPTIRLSDAFCEIAGEFDAQADRIEKADPESERSIGRTIAWRTAAGHLRRLADQPKDTRLSEGTGDEDDLRLAVDEAQHHLRTGDAAKAQECLAEVLPPRLSKDGGEEALRERLLSDEVIDKVAEERCIEELYGHWEDFPAKEANQKRRYAQLAKKPGVQESWKEGVRREAERLLAVLAATNQQPQDEQGAEQIDTGECFEDGGEDAAQAAEDTVGAQEAGEAATVCKNPNCLNGHETAPGPTGEPQSVGPCPDCQPQDEGGDDA